MATITGNPNSSILDTISHNTVDMCGDLTLVVSDETKYRSVIVDTSTGHPISFFFPHTSEYTQEEIYNLDGDFGGDLSEWNWIPSYEGTIIRMFYHDGKWKTSTRRRIDADKSYWGSNISFGEMFATNSTEISRESLNTNLTYTFLLTTNSHNRIVSEPSETPLIFTGAFEGSKFLFESATVEGVFKPSTFKFNTRDELVKYVENIDTKKYQGVLGYNPNTQSFMKVTNTTYNHLRRLRDNEPDLRTRYIQTLSDSELHRKFREHFHEHARLFRRLDGSLHGLARDLLHGNIKECDSSLVKLFNGVRRSHKGIISWLSSLDTNLLWSSVIYRLKNCRTVPRDTEEVKKEIVESKMVE